MTNETQTTDAVITPDQLLQHWQGHRGLTRRMIEAFPEEQLFQYSIGGMRPFADLAKEFLRMATPMLCGLVTGEWASDDATANVRTKAELLRRWDEATEEINTLWPQLAPRRFQETDTAFGQWPGTVYSLLWYVIDNEIHHRGQGYVYLRALGIEPPPFYERS